MKLDRLSRMARGLLVVGAMNDQAKPPSLEQPPLRGGTRAFNLADEIETIRRDKALGAKGHTAVTLVKEPDLRLVLIVMSAGARIHEHKADASVSIQALDGLVRFRVSERTIDLPKGRLITLARSVVHDVEALEVSALLLTLAWQR